MSSSIQSTNKNPLTLSNNNNTVTIPSNIDEHNELSYKIERYQKLQNEDLSRIAAIDTVMRETIALIVDVAGAQLRILKQLLEQPVESRNFTAASDALKVDLRQIWENSLEDYISLLKARGTYMENGQEMPLTKENRERLQQEFTTTLTQTLNQLEHEIEISPQADLEKLKSQIEEKVKVHKKIHDQMLDNKTTLTEGVYRNINNLTGLANLRQRLHSPEVKDIWTASRAGATDYLQQLIKKLWPWQVKEFVNQKTREGNTLLHVASQYGQLEIVQLLLKNKADPHLSNPEGYLPIHLAAKYGATQIVRAFLNCQNPLDINVRGAYGRTPLHMATFNSCYETVEFLLKRGANVNAQTDPEDHLKTPLHDAVLHLDELMVSSLLSSPHLDVNIPDVQHHTPLYHAVLDGCYKIVALIIGHVSWKSSTDPQDPNHMDQLLQLTPRCDAEKIKDFLRACTGRRMSEKISSSSSKPNPNMDSSDHDFEQPHWPPTVEIDREVAKDMMKSDPAKTSPVKKSDNH